MKGAIFVDLLGERHIGRPRRQEENLPCLCDLELDVGGQRLVIRQRLQLPQLVGSRGKGVVDPRDGPVLARDQLFVAGHGIEVDRRDVVNGHLAVQGEFHAGQRPVRLRVFLDGREGEGSVLDRQDRLVASLYEFVVGLVFIFYGHFPVIDADRHRLFKPVIGIRSLRFCQNIVFPFSEECYSDKSFLI